MVLLALCKMPPPPGSLPWLSQAGQILLKHSPSTSYLPYQSTGDPGLDTFTQLGSSLDCELLDGQACDMFIAESLAQHLKPLVLSKYLLSE